MEPTTIEHDVGAILRSNDRPEFACVSESVLDECSRSRTFRFVKDGAFHGPPLIETTKGETSLTLTVGSGFPPKYRLRHTVLRDEFEVADGRARRTIGGHEKESRGTAVEAAHDTFEIADDATAGGYRVLAEQLDVEGQVQHKGDRDASASEVEALAHEFGLEAKQFLRWVLGVDRKHLFLVFGVRPRH